MCIEDGGVLLPNGPQPPSAARKSFFASGDQVEQHGYGDLGFTGVFLKIEMHWREQPLACYLLLGKENGLSSH